MELNNIFKPVMTATKNPVLAREEIDLLSAVIVKVLDAFERKMYGTIILDAQRDGEPANLLYKCNVGDGAFKVAVPGRRVHTSDDLAALAIDEILKPLTESCYRRSFKLNARNDKDAVPSGIYRRDELTVMVLNVTGGRILGSVYLQDGFEDGVLVDESFALLMSLRTAFEVMFQDDDVLQYAIREEFSATNIDEMYVKIGPWRYMDIVQVYIEHSDDEACKRWRALEPKRAFETYP